MQRKSSGSAEDGRRRRSAESRGRIVAAMLALVREGKVAPSAEEVAKRADVGLRSVFRHFENMDSLYREMNVLMTREVLPLFAAPYAASGWRARLNEMIARRAEIFERILPVKTAADVHKHHSPFLRTESKRLAALQRKALRELLPQTMAAVLEPLDLLLSFESWRRLREEQRLSRKEAEALLRGMAAKLLA